MSDPMMTSEPLAAIVPRVHLWMACLDCDHTTQVGIIRIKTGGTERYELLCERGCGHGFYATVEEAAHSLSTGDDGHCRLVPMSARFIGP